MKKEEAIIEMIAGKRITHRCFSSDEWMMIQPQTNLIVFEDGGTINLEIFSNDGSFWCDGYSVYKLDKQ